MATKEDIQSLILNLIEDKIELSKALLKAKAINKRVKNKELTELILGEVEEKYNDDTLPEYRLIWGEPTFEFRNRFTQHTDIRNLPLPEAKHFNGKSTNFRPILFSVSEIEEAVKSNSDTIKISLTPDQLVFAKEYLEKRITNMNDWQLIQAWWSHSPTSFSKLLFKIKQKLIDVLTDIEVSLLENDSAERIFSEKTQFDASFEILQIIESAKDNIILVDGYVDGTSLKLLSSKQQTVTLQILTDPKALSESLQVLVKKFNDQYKGLEIRTSKSFHDRFLILDGTHFYQIGASLKDLGNKTFTFVKLKEPFITDALMNKVNQEWKKS